MDVWLGAGILVVFVGLALGLLVADRLLAMARTRRYGGSARMLVGGAAVVGGPAVWLLLWWLLREPRPA